MKKEKNNKKIFKILKKIIIVILILVSLFFIILGIKTIYINVHSQNVTDLKWINKHTSITKNKSLGSNIYSVNKDKDVDIYGTKYREVIDNKLSKLREEKYSFNNMLMIYNLYGTNTLGLNVFFETNEKTNLSYTISVADDNISDFTRTLKNDEENNLTKNHQYQIIGFVPGYKNKIKFTLKNKDGHIIKEKTITLNLTNIKSNSEVKLTTKKGKSKEELSNGLYTILGNDSDEQDYVAMYDNDGIIRSEIPIIGYRAHQILFKDNLMYFSISQTKIVAMNRTGKIEEIYRTSHYKLHHDYTFDDDGNLLVLANNQNKKTEEDCIIRINLKTKKVDKVVDMEKLFKSYVKTCTLDETSQRDEGEDGLDWIHLNSIEWVNGDVILSSRETSSIIKIKDIEKNPKIDYILADKTIWEETDYSSYLYEKIGDFKIHAGQHSVRYSATNEEGIYYLTLYNNNYGVAKSQPKLDYTKIGITNQNAFVGDNSYYYIYKIDENNKTFELTDSFKVPYSGIVSSVQTLENNNIIIDSGTAGIFREYDQNNKMIKSFKIKMNKYMVYRVLKYDYKNYWFNE